MSTSTWFNARCLTIDGWLTREEAMWLAEQARDHKCIVEIGSYLGRSTRAMLDHTEGVVYAVDDWKGPRDVYMTKEERQGLYEKFLANVEGFGKKLIRVKLDHAKEEAFAVILSMEPDMFPDMVFIDGSHEYLDVKRDIEIWKPKLVKGGLLCGHDAGIFDGVDRAVSELLGDVEVADNTSIWYVYV